MILHGFQPAASEEPLSVLTGLLAMQDKQELIVLNDGALVTNDAVHE
jgi:hypothetical protein